MQIAPEIVYHGIERSDWVDAYVLERMERLDKFAQGITRCHVTLTLDQASHQTGNRHSVAVEVRIPPHHDLAARKSRDIRDARTEIPALINQAFGAIERQVKKTAELRRYDVKSDGGEPHGLVEKLFAEGYGFIRSVTENRQIYFHRNSVRNGDFERLAVGTEVRFVAQDGDKGPQASSVRIVNKPGALSEA